MNAKAPRTPRKREKESQERELGISTSSTRFLLGVPTLASWRLGVQLSSVMEYT
jgi:hypothetical protein